MNEPREVRVRIAVAVDAKGNWSSAGWGSDGKTHDDAMGLAIEGVEDGERRFWLTASLPLPTVDEVPPVVSEESP